MVFDWLGWSEEDQRWSTWVELIRGSIRVFFKGWKSIDFRVRSGCSGGGIRGSDVLIVYDPTRERVSSSVLEGHMDVTSSTTGETESLTDLKWVVMLDGEMGEVHTFTEDQWLTVVTEHGLDNMQGLSPEEWEALWSQAQPAGGIPAPLIAAAVVLVAALGAGVILLRRRRPRAGEVAALPGDGAAALPAFCRLCGSVITPGSSFCEGCGERLRTGVPPSRSG
jgi:hypothetical protein